MISNWTIPVSNWTDHLMQCLDYSNCKSRSVIGTLVATEDGKRLIEFFKDEFDLDMNSDPSISTTQYGITIEAVFMREPKHLKSHDCVSILVITNRL